MPLPNTGMSFTPFDPLPASDLNDLVENIEALADGSAIDAITSEKLDATIACRAYRNAAQTINSAGGEDKVVFDAENFDLGADFNTTTGTFTAPIAGIYHIETQVTIDNLDAATDNMLVYIKVNGADFVVHRVYSSAASGDPRGHVSTLAQLAANDTVEIYANHSSATATESINVGSANTYVAIYFVGA